MLKIWKKYWWVVLFLACLPHAIYSVRYVIFGLVHDEKAAVISELAHAKIKQSFIPYITPPEKILFQLSGDFGCSFLLMEEIWRDCKTIYLGKATQILNTEQKNELALLLKDVVTKPCDSLKIVGAGTAYGFKEILGCGSIQSEYFLTLIYLHNEKRHFLTTFKGEFK